MKRRLKLVKVSGQMQEWSAALGAELSGWQGVTAKKMFGMTVYFRKGRIFAALPLSRSFETATSVAFKLYKKTPERLRQLKSDSLVLPFSSEDPKWIVLDLQDEKDLNKALKWYSIAYRECL